MTLADVANVAIVDYSSKKVRVEIETIRWTGYVRGESDDQYLVLPAYSHTAHWVDKEYVHFEKPLLH